MENKVLNIRYALLQGFYWSYFAIIVSFATVFFLSHGLSDEVIGIVASLGNILSSVIQPLVARIADKSRILSIKEIASYLLVISVIPIIILLFFNPIRMIAIMLFVLSSIFLWTLHPLVNSIGVHYINKGEKLDFGFARAFGSAFFAITSIILGRLIKEYGVNAMLYSAMLLALLVFLILNTFKIEVRNSGGLSRSSIVADEDDNIFTFIPRYGAFMLWSLGVFFMYAFHNMVNTYFPQIISHVGGEYNTLGLALGISAMMEVPMMLKSDSLIKKYGSARFLTFSAFFWIMKSLGLILAFNVSTMLIVMLLQAFSYGPYVPGTVHYTNEVMHTKDKYLGQAVMTGASTLGGVLGNILGGRVLKASNIPSLLNLGLLFVSLGAFILVIAMFLQGKFRRENTNTIFNVSDK